MRHLPPRPNAPDRRGHDRAPAIWPLAEYVRCRPALLDGSPDTPFSRYLRGVEKNLTLGQMFKILRFAERPTRGLISSFAEWLKGDSPFLLAALRRVRTDKLEEYRNREAHPDPRIIDRREADEANQISRDLIHALHQC